MKLFAIVALVAMPVWADQAFEPSTVTGVGVPPDPFAPVWSGPRAELFDNGPVLTHTGTGVGGADESWLQTTLGMGIYGFGHAQSAGYRVADQFTIPAGETWDITNVTFFAYQSFAGTTSTMTVLRRLRQSGYRTSYSHRGKYYTLTELPQFDNEGLPTRGLSVCPLCQFGS